ncbi:hypothetical protein D4764_22G0000330 [Takifugu flavidus]|uniref:Uncharacterized protein n=1 Tax=Takifugu flavidus TaxID=433684 RepID=A0A5C6NB24_9TELE|nr:hypothetical protein D4764_22G0000330 [Takifugu flavidus]
MRRAWLTGELSWPDEVGVADSRPPGGFQTYWTNSKPSSTQGGSNPPVHGCMDVLQRGSVSPLKIPWQTLADSRPGPPPSAPQTAHHPFRVEDVSHLSSFVATSKIYK